MPPHFARLIAVIATLLWGLVGTAGPAWSAPTQRVEDARVIVWYRAQGALMRALAARPAEARQPMHAAALSQRLGLALTDGHAIGNRAQVVHATGISSAQLAARLAADSEVELAVPDVRRHVLAAPNDPLYPGAQISATPTVGQWYLRAPNSTEVSAINAEGAWNTTTGSSTVVVAVLDTGVRFDHPDLAGKLYPGYDFISNDFVAHDANPGRDSDASDPGDWVTQADVDSLANTVGCTSAEIGNSSWHGTEVAGLVGAATNNGVGMASVGRNVMVLPVRVLGRCGGFDSDIQAAMLWAAGLSSNPVVNTHPAKVINLSLGSQGTCPASYLSVISQLTTAGVTVVASAGNDEGLAVAVPANCSGVIAVGGLRHAGSKVGYSNVGPEVTLSAPAGNCVNVAASDPCLYPLLTTTNTGTTVPATNTYSDSFTPSLGTSFSAPLVAGTAALMLSVDPTLSVAQIRGALRSSARSFPTTGAAVCHAPNGAVQDECDCTTDTCGAGMLDAAGAVTLPPTVVINASSSSPTAGTAVALDGSASTAVGGRIVSTYQWTITSGSGIATLANASTARPTLSTSGAGAVVVKLTVADSAGAQGSASSTVSVAAAPPPPPPSSGGGGGALGIAWLLALGVAIRAVARSR